MNLNIFKRKKKKKKQVQGLVKKPGNGRNVTDPSVMKLMSDLKDRKTKKQQMLDEIMNSM